MPDPFYSPALNPLDDPHRRITGGMRSPSGEYVAWYNSYSGSDTQIYVIVDGVDISKKDQQQNIPVFRPLAELQTLSISSARNVYPVRRLGESHVTEYTRGARTIAGSMVFATGRDDFFAYLTSRSRKEKSSGAPFFMDEFPSFHILITCANEYGQVSHSALTDVTLTNWGTTHSESDMYLETTYTYVARYYHPHVADPNLLPKITSVPQGKLSTLPGKSDIRYRPLMPADLDATLLEAGFNDHELGTIQSYLQQTFGLNGSK